MTSLVLLSGALESKSFSTLKFSYCYLFTLYLEDYLENSTLGEFDTDSDIHESKEFLKEVFKTMKDF